MPNPLENPQPVGSHVILAEHMLRAALHLVEDLQPRYNELNKQRVQFGGSPFFALPILAEMTSLLEQLGGAAQLTETARNIIDVNAVSKN